ncbi:MAG: nitroreductase family protein [Phocaeicola sp.]
MKLMNNLLVGLGMIAFTSCCAQNKKCDTPCEEKNQVVEAIMQRRSIRQYKDQPVEMEKLQTIMECAVNAPSGMNKQPWEVRVVTSESYINGVTEIYKKANPKMAEDPSFKNMFRNAPVVIFVATPSASGHLDAGLLGQNIMLSAYSLGLGTCCLGSPPHFMKTTEAAAPYIEKLNLPEGYELLYAIGVGYADETPDAKPRDAAKVKFID